MTPASVATRAPLARHVGVAPSSEESAPRRGVALVAALALLVLGAALLTGSALASVGVQRSSRTRVAGARARAEALRGLALVLQGWETSLDSLPVGARADRSVPMEAVVGLPVASRARVRRLSPSLYAVTVEVRVGDSAAVIATRRARVFMARAEVAGDSASVPSVTALGRWSVVELP